MKNPLNALLGAPGPGRILCWSTLINMTGSGMYLASSALFFVRYLGLPASDVGLALSTSGLIGLLAGVPVGRLADLRGPRGVYLTTLLVEAASMAVLVFARSFWAFVAITTVTSLAASASTAARGPLIRSIADGHPAQLRARVRSLTNLGITLGGALAGVALASNTPIAYLLLVLGNALSFAGCALVVLRLPPVPVPASRGVHGRWQALADRPYLGIVAVNLVMMLQYPVLPLILPLWVYAHSDVPHWLVASLIPLNTIMVTVLQLRMSRGIDTPQSAARLMPRAAVALLVGFAIMSALGALPGWAAVIALLVSVVIYTLGEILFSAAGYELGFALAPAEAQGQYMGLYGLGGGLGRALSQAVVGFLCLSLGVVGWFLLGAVMMLAGLATPVITRYALRHRPSLAASEQAPAEAKAA